ncbi:hypothetical protein L0U85_08730 [Glycomyces sp. L485]|uniref:hypothetical protein n=1 Tax=Glycomyces sp. L485 TaxID=2909235 RepID=UPI001F4A9A8E|nr:hypothetical protein [Glycomyces sp. L485]MCH7230933.1 hypothetical protein [Glycomyces sp. L485]
MAEIRWLVRTRRSEQTIITAPDAPVEVGAAAEQLEAALDGFSGRKPAWFRPLERLGYWWYPICMVATTAAFVVAAPNSLGMNIAYGLGFGVTAAVVTGAILASIAHLQVRLTSGRTVEETVKEVAALARRAGGVADRVEAVLAWDPALEREVHLLAWRAAEVDGPDRSAADRELDELWKQADPVAAANREAKIREIEEGLAALRREGNL